MTPNQRERKLNIDAILAAAAIRTAFAKPKPDTKPDVTMHAEHKRHAALGENHWFSCEWCDDEADE